MSLMMWVNTGDGYAPTQVVRCRVVVTLLAARSICRQGGESFFGCLSFGALCHALYSSPSTVRSSSSRSAGQSKDSKAQVGSGIFTEMEIDCPPASFRWLRRLFSPVVEPRARCAFRSACRILIVFGDFYFCLFIYFLLDICIGF
jgi:hypothetical protein